MSTWRNRGRQVQAGLRGILHKAKEGNLGYPHPKVMPPDWGEPSDWGLEQFLWPDQQGKRCGASNFLTKDKIVRPRFVKKGQFRKNGGHCQAQPFHLDQAHGCSWLVAAHANAIANIKEPAVAATKVSDEAPTVTATMTTTPDSAVGDEDEEDDNNQGDPSPCCR
jgi:hypothetical protein